MERTQGENYYSLRRKWPCLDSGLQLKLILNKWITNLNKLYKFKSYPLNIWWIYRYIKTTIESLRTEYTSLFFTKVLIHICVYCVLGEVYLFLFLVPLVSLLSVPVMANFLASYGKACNSILLGLTFFWAKQKHLKLFYANLSHSKTLLYIRNIKEKVFKNIKKKKSIYIYHTSENSRNQ